MADPALRLSPEALRRVAAAESLIQGLLALEALARLVDPTGTRRWGAAVEIAARLRHFECSEVWKRIRRGDREPRDRSEALMVTILQTDLPRSREKIHALLV